MKYLIYLVFILLSLGQLLRISFFDQTVNIYLHEMIMVTIIGLLFKSINLKKILENQSVKYFGLFILSLFLSLIWYFWQFSLFTNIVGFLYLFRLLLYFLFFMCLFKIDKKILKKGVHIFTALTIVFSLSQYVLYPNLRNLYYLGWDPHQFRLFGTFFDTTIMGMVLAAAFFYHLAYSSGRLRITILAILFGLILLTYSRITYVSFLLASGFFFFKKHNFQLLFILILAFIAIIPFLPRPGGAGVKLERVFSIESRVIDQKIGLVSFLKNPFVGIGYNRIFAIKEDAATEFPSHSQSAFSSSYITILATSGLIGLAMFLFFLSKLYGSVDVVGKSVLLCVFIASFFDNVFLNNFILLLVLILARLTTVSTARKSP